MARRRKIRKVRKAHPRLFRYLTIFGATIGIASGTAFSAIMAIDAAKGDLISEDVREYTASFSSEGSILSKTTYKRGEPLEMPQNPEHSIDGESNYFFIGWDTNKNGIPDFIPPNAYYSFEAEAVYFRTGKFDLDFLDLLNMDLEDLLQLLEDLNIDWEQFMSMFNIDPEMLMQLLGETLVLTYNTRPGTTESPIYFRSTSYGDFDYGKKTFKNPNCYDVSRISDNSVNPLSFTAYKLKKLEDLGVLPSNFGFINYDITFAASQDYYPVPDCEYSNNSNEIINSDAHYILEPKNNKYQTSAVYCPAFGYVIDLLDAVPLTGTVARDEKKYYDYAIENYTSIPREYEQVIDEMIEDNGWYPEETYQVDSIAAYVSSLGQCSLFNDDGTVDINSYLNSQKKSSDPVMDLITTQRGSDLDFNTTAVMLFRRLNIPARLVKGYVTAGSSATKTNSIYLVNQHYWCEIYIKGTGWMICDCMDFSAVLGTNPYKDIDQSNTPLQDKHVLDRIVVHQPDQKYREYVVGDEFDYTHGSLTAYFKDGQSVNLNFNSPGVTVEGFDSTAAGAYKITITYEYEGVQKSASFYITVKDSKKKLSFIEFDTSGAKDWYYEGEEIDTSGVVATGHYDDGTTGPLSAAVTYSSGFSSVRRTNPYTVTVGVYNSDTADLALNSKQTTYQVRVYYRRIDEIVVTNELDKDEYYAHEKFSAAGLEFKFLNYKGDLETLASSRYTITAPTQTQMDKAGDYVYKISYTNDYEKNTITKEIPIKVLDNKPKDLTVTGYKDTYYVGEPFDKAEFLKNASAIATFDHTDPESIETSKLSVVTPDLTMEGDTTVEISYSNGVDPKVTATVPISVIVTSGTIDIKSYSIEDETEYTYNGQSHSNVTCTYDQPSNLPSFLHAVVDMGETGSKDNGRDVDEHHVQPTGVRILDSNNVDYTYAYNYTIGENGDGVTYYVNPRSVTITLSPANASYKKGENVVVNVSADGLASGDTASFIGGVSFDYVGTYSNYFKDFGSVRITRYGVDVTHCYDITYVYKSVVITD